MKGVNPVFGILQLAGGTFPTGAFSQSFGLETYVDSGRVFDEKSFRSFLDTFLHTTLAGVEGPLVCAVYDAVVDRNLEGFYQIDERITALKLTKESRENCKRMGKSMLRIASQMKEETRLAEVYEKVQTSGISYPAAFALVSAIFEIGKEEMLDAFLFSSLNSLLQSGIKLIPLGNVQAQRILLERYPDLAVVREQVLQTDPEDVAAFCPALDIASMQHETLATRLYMS